MNSIRKILAALREQNIRLVLNEGNIEVLSYGKKLTPEVVQIIKSNKEGLLEYLRSIEQGNDFAGSEIPLSPAGESYPLSSAQKRLWVLGQIEETSVAYNMPSYVELQGSCDVDSFYKAIQFVVGRHEILRTVFREDAHGEIRQWVLPLSEMQVRFDCHDFSEEENCYDKVKAFILKDSFAPFDFENGPLLRTSLIRTSTDTYVFYYNMHHIVSDEWSMEIIKKELFYAYELFKNNARPALPDLRIQYKDYAVWQLMQAQNEAYQSHKDYWVKQFEGEIPLLEIATDKPRPKIMTHNGRSITVRFDTRMVESIRALNKQEGGTMFMGLLAFLNLLLYKYTFQNTIVVGSTIAGREHPDLEDQIGFYVNTLPLKTEFSDTDTFRELYQRVRQVVLGAYAHQEYPFDELVSALDLTRDVSRNPLFDISIDLHNIEDAGGKQNFDGFAEGGLNTSEYELAKFDMSFEFGEIGDALTLSLNYNTDIFSAAQINRLIDNLKALIQTVTNGPSQALADITILSKNEEQELLYHLNPTGKPYPYKTTIVQLFEEQVARTPDNIAVIFEDTALSFSELNALANQLGAYIRAHHEISPGDFIGIRLDRSECLMVAILGALKAGGAYVPIDPEYPKDRIEYMISDSQCKVLIDADFLAGFKSEQHRYGRENAPSKLQPNDLMYCIYTSGSTGNPKGVLIEHQSVANILYAWKEAYGLDERVSLLQLASISFDVFVADMCRSVFIGGQMVICSNAVKLEWTELYALMNRHKISFLEGTPGLLIPFLNYLKEANFSILSSPQMVFSSDTFKLTDYIHISNAFKGQLTLINSYGTTEGTIDSTYFIDDSPEKYFSINTPIGKGFGNNEVYLLDRYNRLVPYGALGEICIGGLGVGRGYLNRPDLTHEKFVEDPYKPGTRLYKTGDWGRWMDDGNLEYLGRIDAQIKIRGFRIELGEIENTLLGFEGILEAVVLAKAADSGEKELVAYLVFENNHINMEKLRSYLLDKLPYYMVPRYFISLDRMPLNANGKIDRRALLHSSGAELSTGIEYVAPATEEEKVLVAVMEDVLRKEKIGVYDNFYSLGGDSIKSIQIVSRLKQKGYSLKVQHILQKSIIKDFALVMQRIQQVVDQSEVAGAVELTPVQRNFFADLTIVRPSHYNQSVVLACRELDLVVLRKCLAELTRHHDMLRARYQLADGQWRQIVADASNERFELVTYDIRQIDDEAAAMYSHGEQLQKNINLEEGPLVKVASFQVKDGYRLAIVIHHLVVDGISWRIILEDLSQLYEQFQRGAPVALPAKTNSFQQWAGRIQNYAAAAGLLAEKDYWNSLGLQHIEPLPFAAARGIDIDGQRESSSFTLSARVTDLIQSKIHQVYKTNINDVLLTGLGLAIRDVFQREKTVIEMEGHGREEILPDIDISRTVGWFTSVFPFVLDTSSGEDRKENLIRIKEDLRRIPNKGIGYGILKYIAEAFAEEPHPSVVFNYLGDFGNDTAGDDDERFFDYSSDNISPDVDPANVKHELLDVSGILVSGQLTMVLHYYTDNYTPEIAQKLMDAYRFHLESLVAELDMCQQQYLTPSDLTFKGLSIEELDALNADGRIEDVYELSPLQNGIYYHWLSEKSTSEYFEQVCYKLRSAGLRVEAVRQAFQQLVNRYAILRTSFTYDYAGVSLQVVRKEVACNFSYEKISQSLSKEARLRVVEREIAEDQEAGFDLEDFSLMRLRLLDLGDDEYTFIWSHHHILMDGWCMSILINDFEQLLEAVRFGSIAKLEAPAPYSNYINWLATVDRKESMQYWRDYLEGYSAVADLPFKAKPSDALYQPAAERVVISGKLYQDMSALCRATGITQNIFIQCVWGFLLAQYNNTRDVVFGEVVSGRPSELPGVEDMVGLFINTIPVRIQYENDSTPIDVFKKVLQNAIESTPHHYVDLPDVQSLSELGRNLIQHIIIFENYPVQDQIKEGLAQAQQHREADITIDSIDIFERTNYDFNLFVTPLASELIVDLKFDSNTFDAAFIACVAKHFYILVEQFTWHSGTALGEQRFLPAGETEKLQEVFNDFSARYDARQTIVQLFSQHVQKSPGHVAVSFGAQKLTYEALDAFSNQIGALLYQHIRPKPASRIGVFLNRGSHMISAILAVIKAGCAYVPLDPELPEERILYILEDAGIEVIITEKELLELGNKLQWKSDTLAHLICIDSESAYEAVGEGEHAIGQKGLWDHIGDTMETTIGRGGWVSSYTGQAFSAIEMEEYAENTYRKLEPILHKDMKVLEIGCSSGITLFRLAPLVKTYHGTDISPAILEKTTQELKSRGLENVQLTCLPAHQIDLLEENEFDLVIINSVVHYFSGFNYLRKVLAKSVDITKDEGVIFLGDLMDEARRQALIDSLTTYRQQHPNGNSVKTDWSGELFVPKGYLSDLLPDGMGIQKVVFSDKIHTVKNELTEFRYDATLFVNKHAPPSNSHKLKHQYGAAHFSGLSTAALHADIRPDDLVYSIYTSGSTGRPKGVLVEHRNLASMIDSFDRNLSGQGLNNIAATTNFSFDISILELLGSLCTGRTAVMFSEDELLDTDRFMDKIQQDGVEILQLTPTRLLQLGQDFYERNFDRLRVLLIGGEALREDQYVRLRAIKGLKSYNCYGPTETTIWSTYLDLAASRRLSIGRPFQYEQAVILTESGHPAPIGVPGELCIGGAGVSRGYLNRPDLTNEKFIPHPILPGQRLYKTGDIARWLPDGNIECLGRSDDQVKMRGYRIELDEISNVLSRHEAIQAAVVLLRSNETDQQLVAYYVSENTIPVPDIKRWLAQSLPHYMVPLSYLKLAELPMTPSGKIDKRALLNVGADADLDRAEYIPAKTETELRLVKIWESLLRARPIGILDNFFSLGGNSLHVVQLLSKIHKEFKVRLTVEQVFSEPTIQKMSEAVESMQVISTVEFDYDDHNTITI